MIEKRPQNTDAMNDMKSKPSPNISFQADPDPRERGSGPLNSSR